VAETGTNSVMGYGSGDLQIQFMKLLVAQLQNQNPLDPMDNGEMTAQLAQIASLEQLERINGALAAVTDEDSAFAAALEAAQARYAASLLGRRVTFETGEGLATGTVEAVLRAIEETAGGGERATIRLQVGDHQVPLEAVREVRS